MDARKFIISCQEICASGVQSRPGSSLPFVKSKYAYTSVDDQAYGMQRELLINLGNTTNYNGNTRKFSAQVVR